MPLNFGRIEGTTWQWLRPTILNALPINKGWINIEGGNVHGVWIFFSKSVSIYKEIRTLIHRSETNAGRFKNSYIIPAF